VKRTGETPGCRMFWINPPANRHMRTIKRYMRKTGHIAALKRFVPGRNPMQLLTTGAGRRRWFLIARI